MYIYAYVSETCIRMCTELAAMFTCRSTAETHQQVHASISFQDVCHMRSLNRCIHAHWPNIYLLHSYP